MVNIGDLKTVFAGCAKNCGNYLPIVLENIDHYSKLFKKTSKIIVENGSTDKTKEIVKYLLVGQRVWQLAFTPDQKTLLSTNGVSNDVSIINVDKLKVEKSVKVGRFPWGVVISPN